MSELRFGTTVDERLMAIEGFCQRVNGDLYGNGRAGFVERVLQFMDRMEAEESEREQQQVRRHRENTEKLDEVNSKVGRRSLWVSIAGAAIAIAGVAVAIAAILVSIWLATHIHADPAQIFNHSTNVPVLAWHQQPPQDAGTPPPPVVPVGP